MARLVVVSNRVNGDAGGLAVGIEGALKASGGLWFGWSGMTDSPGELQTRRVGNVDYVLIDVEKADFDGYYAGFSNGAVWPLFHNRLDLVQFHWEHFEAYRRVNRLFAEKLRPLLQPDDVIWVHDYHLMLLAAELRALGVDNQIGYFLHIPFPAPDLLFALPSYREVLRGLAAFDLVGFQTEDDVDNFARSMRKEGLGRRTDGRIVDAYGASFRAAAYPIGIETARFADMATRAFRNNVVQRTLASLNGRKLLIGVDRLDYSKGLSQRIEAFSDFLEQNPAMRRQVTYLQVTPKSRSDVPGYQEMQRAIAELAGRLNGQYGAVDWTPMRYVNRPLGRPALAGLYRASRVGLVTPLRDGMNLVAKEYVAAQNPADPGVLMLSRFAGAAHELDGALLVNPYDRREMSEAIGHALNMPLAERLNRWRGMFARILRNDVHCWRERFLRDLEQVRRQPLAITA